MSKLRYKQIEFKNFQYGRWQKKTYGKDDQKFLTSKNLQHDFEYNSLRISPGFDVQVLDGVEVYGDFYRAITSLGSYNYFFTKEDVTNLIKVYRRTGFNAYGLRFTFHADYNTMRYCLAYRDKLIAFLYNTTLSKNVIVYSDDGGSTWTYVDWIYGNPTGHTITPDGSLYIVTYTGEIVSIVDLTVFELIYDGSSSAERITSVENLDGFVYVTLLLDSERMSVFCRLDGAELTYLHKITGISTFAKLKTFDNRLFFSALINGIIYIYEYDKGDVSIISYIDEYIFYDCSLEVADNDHLYIVASNDDGDYFSRLIYAMNIKNGIFKVKDFTCSDVLSIHSLNLYKNRLICHIHDWTDEDDEIYDTGDMTKSIGSGELETSVLDVENHIPVSLLVKHSKLPGPVTGNQSIKVYYKKDYATSWTLALTSDVKDSVSKSVVLSGLGSVDFIQFKITLDDTVKKKISIEDLTLKYFYISSGIESSDIRPSIAN